MNKDELIKHILEIPAENQTLEFKRLGGSNNDVGRIIESIVAMANIDGGVMVLGVEDPERTKLKGLDRVFGIEENVENYDHLGREIQRIIPPLGSIWPPEKIEISAVGKNIALLFIPKVTDAFRSINNHVFVRLEKSNKRLTPAEVVKFAYAKGFEHADRELVEVDLTLIETPVYTRPTEK